MGFEDDVFISYAHVDNETLAAGQDGWVSLLHDRLNKRLQQLRREEVKNWRESKLQGYGEFTEALLTKLQRSALFICVLSPAYIKSKWRLNELREFHQRRVTRGDKVGVFKVVKKPVPFDEQPEELQGLLGYDFYESDSATGDIHEFSPELSAKHDNRYWSKLEDLAQDILRFLADMKSWESQAALRLDAGKNIYLAETTSDRAVDRDKVKRELEAFGCIVTPDAELPRTTADEVEAHVRAYLLTAEMSVHLIGERYGLIPEMAAGRSIVRIQHDLAQARGADPDFRRVIWIPNNLKNVEPAQQVFIKYLQEDHEAARGAELVQGNLEELKTAVHNLLKPKPKPKALPSNGYSGKALARVYLICDEPDYEDTEILRDYLYEQRLELLEPIARIKLQDFQEHKELLLLADAVMVYYGKVSDVWTRQQLRELQKLPGYGRDRPLFAKAFYLSAPSTPDKDEFFTYEARVIHGYDGFDPRLLEDFINDIKLGMSNYAGQQTAMITRDEKVRLFYSYSHRDEKLRDELETHLTLLQRQGLIDAWHDRKIGAGDEWKGAIDENLERADVILLLISADFIASDYAFDIEMKRALARHEEQKARVIPVIVRDVNWRNAQFARLQALPKDGKAVTLWENRDTAWRNVSEGIEHVVMEVRRRRGLSR